MVDNFDQLAQFMTFDDAREFYFVQIIRRAKDVPEIGSNNQYIKSYSVYSSQELLDKKIRIIDLCNRMGARAYMHPSPRNDETIALMMMEELAALIRTRQYPNTRNLWATMCGRYIPEKRRRLWLIDVDESTEDDKIHLISMLDSFQPINVPKERLWIPTKNGWHLITIPFDLAAFSKEFPAIDVHKNNPTVLFCP